VGGSDVRLQRGHYGLDGIEAARRIKKRSPLTQVVILTAYEDASLMTEALEAGVYCYLVKGCIPGSFVTC
jgi:DNA-binding NarL/FixJ family response regulator